MASLTLSSPERSFLMSRSAQYGLTSQLPQAGTTQTSACVMAATHNPRPFNLLTVATQYNT
jgi:hypothetical protein